MIRRLAPAAALVLFVGCAESPTELPVDGGPGALVSAADGSDRIGICHLSEETGLFHMIEVSTNATEAHLAHGDGLPGGTIPGRPGQGFGVSCEIVNLGPTRIVFRSTRAGTYGGDLFVMERDGSGLVHLTMARAADLEPHWNADGTRVAFRRQATGLGAIYTIAADGTDERQVSFPSTSADVAPRWSPDGSKIAFISRRDGDREIYVANSDGSGETRLTNSPGTDTWPRWSPDGTRILFASFRTGGTLSDIYVMNSDGTGVTRLTSGVGNEGVHDWSPDGTKIVYAASGIGVFVMAADGSSPTLIHADGTIWIPTWSPDGSLIAFTKTVGGQRDLFVINADGSGAVNVTNSTTNEQDYAWSPDSRQLVTSGFDATTGAWDIYRVNADGTGQINITNSVGTDQHPNWGR